MFTKKRSGQSVVEFMLMLPILLFMAVMAMDIGMKGVERLFAERARTEKVRAADTLGAWLTSEGDSIVHCDKSAKGGVLCAESK